RRRHLGRAQFEKEGDEHRRLTALAAVQEGEALEQVDVLLVLPQPAVQGRDQLVRVAGAQPLGRDVLYQQQLDPVEQFRGRRLLLQSGYVANIEKDRQRLVHQVVLEPREMHVDDALHRVAVREADVVKEAAAEKRVGQLLFIVRGDHDDRALLGGNRLFQLVDEELHAVEFEQEIVRELDIGLVDLVDQQDR